MSLNSIYEIFSIQPTEVDGSANLSLVVTNNTLDYENPSQRKFVVLLIAKETLTKQQYSSTTSLILTVTDINDNAPFFDHTSYSVTISETTQPGSIILIINAKDKDSGLFGDEGLVYKLEGDGSEKFTVDHKMGSIAIANCSIPGSDNCLDYETKPEYLLNFKVSTFHVKIKIFISPLTFIIVQKS